MEYNIYCDESCHLEHDGIKPMAIGAVWCPREAKDTIFSRLREGTCIELSRAGIISRNY